MGSIYQQVYSGELDPCGMRLNSGFLVEKVLFLARPTEPEDPTLLLVRGDDGTYVGKLVFDGTRTSQTIRVLRDLSHHIKLPIYHIDAFEGDIDQDIILIEEMDHIGRKDVVAMLHSIARDIFAYRGYMAHGDIKPDNIMRSRRTGRYHLIDYDNISNDRMLYGFRRRVFTPLFMSQCGNAEVIITAKQDLIELLWTAHAIYYGCLEQRPMTTLWNGRKFLFEGALMSAWSLNEQAITNESMHEFLKSLPKMG